MATIKDITEPLKIYPQAKEIYHQNALDYFDNLIKESKTNIDANKETCSNYYKKLTDIESSNKANRKKSRFKTFLFVLEIICFITIILIPIGLLIRSHIKNKIDNDIKAINEETDKLTKEANELKAEAVKQTAYLNSLYDWNMAASLVTKTLPIIEMDRTLSREKLGFLMEKYGFSEHLKDDISTMFVQSGSIYGNPFVIERNYVQEMGPFTYTGTLVIHYVTYERDSNGHSHAVHHTETLVAHVTKPKPLYYLDTWLVYGNEAAPKLSFSRSPSNVKDVSEKGLNKLAHKFEKKLDRVAKKDITFTKMANTKFESLFNALDRDNEVEFRLLFTPLAQSNMIDLISAKEPFGDDFHFIKRNRLNFIKTNHAQGFDYTNNPNLFIGFDVEKSKEAFINYCDAYFESFFFDLAPLISIPLYQNYKAQEYIYKDNHKARVTSFEIESLVNNYDKHLLAHKDTATDVILKTEFIKRDGDNDLINVTAHSFKSIPHTALVPTMGGDGRLHNVPVVWYEYIKIARTTPFMIKDIRKSRYEYGQMKNVFANVEEKNVYYQKGIVSTIIRESRSDK